MIDPQTLTELEDNWRKAYEGNLVWAAACDELVAFYRRLGTARLRDMVASLERLEELQSAVIDLIETVRRADNDAGILGQAFVDAGMRLEALVAHAMTGDVVVRGKVTPTVGRRLTFQSPLYADDKVVLESSDDPPGTAEREWVKGGGLE